ncbi:MAG TPA: hypothetical protein VKT78_15215 [Fimbriimonadaceae bacterium]|nr:hypothetical protein [Fimbriimonadaceae bacterium]
MTVGPKWRTFLYSLLAFGSAAAVTVYVNILSRADPFAAMRGPSDISNPIEVEFHNLHLQHYRQGKLITSGQIGRIDVHRDHQQYDLYNVANGIYHTNDGTFHFDGDHAVWYSSAQRLMARGGVHVVSKSFDLRAPSFDCTRLTNILTVEGPATGTLGGGDVTASGIAYNLADDTYSTGKVVWRGKLALNFQNPERSGPPSQGGQSDDKPRIWEVQLDHSFEKNGIKHGTNLRATDGDSIITSPKGSWDRNNNGDIIECEGPVKYWGVKANLICDHMTVDRKKKIATATGNVVMYIKPEEKQTGPDDKMEVPPFRPEVPENISKSRPPAPMASDQHSKDVVNDVRSNENFKKYPATVRADKIVYFYKKGERHAEITGSPQAQQELPEGNWRMVWSYRAHYDGEKETLTLYSSEGNRETRMKNSIGDDGTATRYEFSTKEGDDSYSADNEHVRGQSFDEEANDAAAKAGKKPDKAGTQKPPPGKNPPNLRGPIGRGLPHA